MIDFKETWKIFPLNEEYEISDLGNIRRVKDFSIVGQHIDHGGYRAATIRKHNKRIKVSTAVCYTFNGDRPSLKHNALHNNGDKLDNRACNIRWGTQKENFQDMKDHGTLLQGSQKVNAKLDEEKVKQIKYIFANQPHVTQRELAVKFSVTQPAISQIARGLTWTHVE